MPLFFLFTPENISEDIKRDQWHKKIASYLNKTTFFITETTRSMQQGERRGTCP